MLFKSSLQLSFVSTSTMACGGDGGCVGAVVVTI